MSERILDGNIETVDDYYIANEKCTLLYHGFVALRIGVSAHPCLKPWVKDIVVDQTSKQSISALYSR
jgi:hypothetical protein